VTRDALADAAAAIGVKMPASVLDHVRWTTEVDVLREEDFGIALRVGATGLVTVFIPGSSRSARSVADLVKAFVGPSHARNRPAAAEVSSGHPFGDAIQALADGRPLQVLTVPAGHEGAYLHSLGRLLVVHDRMPPVAARIIRPLAAILRDFEAAVARGDVGEAIALREQAWSTGRLSLVNRSFLDTRVKAAEGDLDGLLDHADRLRLVDLHLPGPVEHAVVDALGLRLLPPLADGDRDVLVRAFRERVAPRFGPVFRDHRVAASPAARWAWIAHYLAIDPVPVAALDEVADQAAGDERERLRSVISGIGQRLRGTAELRTLAEAGENAAVFAAARAGEDLPDDVRADALRRTALALGDPVREAQAQAILPTQGGAAGAGREHDVQTHPSPFAEVDDWESWLRALFAHPDADDARTVLDKGAGRWTERVRAGEHDLGNWADYVEALSGEAAFRRGLPLLVQAVLPQGPEAERLAAERADVLLAFTYAIAEDVEPGTAGLEALGDLAGALLATGLGTDDYAEIIHRCETVYRRLSAPPRLARWVLDLTRTVLETPAPSDEVRDGATRRLVALLLPDARRVRPLVGREVWTELAEVLEDVGGLEDTLPTVRAAAEAKSDDDAFSVLNGKTVLLHTLVESAAGRARAYLESAADVRVLTDSSHVGSGQLREQAAKADLVVVASRAAKHAAFETIRPAASDRLTYARGKGWSSLVTAVTEALSRWT
jgi:hypothetical protein